MRASQRQGRPDFSQLESAVADSSPVFHKEFLHQHLLNNLDKLFLEAYEIQQHEIILLLLNTSALITRRTKEYTLEIRPPKSYGLDELLADPTEGLDLGDHIQTDSLYTFILGTAYKHNDEALIAQVMDEYYKPEMSREVQRVLAKFGKADITPSSELQRMVSPHSVYSPAYGDTDDGNRALDMELMNLVRVVKEHMPEFIFDLLDAHLETLIQSIMEEHPEIIDKILELDDFVSQLATFYTKIEKNFIIHDELWTNNLYAYIFFTACIKRDIAMISKLLTKDSIRSNQLCIGEGLASACYRGDTHIVELLLETNTELGPYAGQALLSAIRTENAPLVTRLIDVPEVARCALDPCLFSVHFDPEKPIHTAVKQGSIPIVRALLTIPSIKNSLLEDNALLQLIYQNDNPEITRVFLEIDDIRIEYTNRLTKALIEKGTHHNNEIHQGVFARFALLIAFTNKNIDVIKALLPSNPKVANISSDDWRYIIAVGLENNTFSEHQELIPLFMEQASREQKAKLSRIALNLPKKPHATWDKAFKEQEYCVRVFITFSSHGTPDRATVKLEQVTTDLFSTVKNTPKAVILITAAHAISQSIFKDLLTDASWATFPTRVMQPPVKPRCKAVFDNPERPESPPLKTKWVRHEFLFLSDEDDGTHIERLKRMIDKGLRPQSRISWGIEHEILPLQATLEVTHNTAFDYLLEQGFYTDLPLPDKLDILQTAVMHKVHESFEHMLHDLTAPLEPEDIFFLIGSKKLFSAVHSLSAPNYKKRTYNVLEKLIDAIIEKIDEDVSFYKTMCFNPKWTANVASLMLFKDCVNDDYDTIFTQTLRLCAEFEAHESVEDYKARYFWTLSTDPDIARQTTQYKKAKDFYKRLKEWPAFPGPLKDRVATHWKMSDEKGNFKYSIRKIFLG